MQTFCFKLATSGLPIEPAVQCWPDMRQNDECDSSGCQIKCGVNKGNLLATTIFMVRIMPIIGCSRVVNSSTPSTLKLVLSKASLRGTVSSAVLANSAVEAVSVVPTLAPIITANAPRSVSVRLCAKPTAMEVTADEDCTRAVLMAPVSAPYKSVCVSLCSRVRRLSPPIRATSSENEAKPCRNSIIAVMIEKIQVSNGVMGSA